MLRKRRWQIVLLLFLAGIINYLDRSALSVAAPLVTQGSRPHARPISA